MNADINLKSKGRQVSLLLLAFGMLGTGLVALPQKVEAAFSGCSSSAYTCTNPSGYSGQKYWGLTTSNGHNCATFVAYVMAKSGATGTANPGWATGGIPAWPKKASQAGEPVNSTPSKGAMYFDIRNTSRPHVAIVVSVTDKYVYLREDNWGGTTKWRRIPNSGFNKTSHGFIHVNDAKVKAKLNAWGWTDAYGG